MFSPRSLEKKKAKLKTWDLLVRWLCHICYSNDPVVIHADSKNTHKHIHMWKHSLTAHLFSVCLWPSPPSPPPTVHTYNWLSEVEMNVYPQGLDDNRPRLKINILIPSLWWFGLHVFGVFLFCCFLLSCWKTQMVVRGFENTNTSLSSSITPQ